MGADRFQTGDPLEKASERLAELSKPGENTLLQRAIELDQRRQEQIRLQKESLDRVMSKLATAHAIIYDDEQWDCCVHSSPTARDSLKSLLVRPTVTEPTDGS